MEGNDNPALTRYRLLNSHTVSMAIAAGYRLRVGCLACNKPKRIVEPRDLPAKFSDTRLGELPFTCQGCKRRRNKPWIGPAGGDAMVEVMYPGEE